MLIPVSAAVSASVYSCSASRFTNCVHRIQLRQAPLHIMHEDHRVLERVPIPMCGSSAKRKISQQRWHSPDLHRAIHVSPQHSLGVFAIEGQLHRRLARGPRLRLLLLLSSAFCLHTLHYQRGAHAAPPRSAQTLCLPRGLPRRSSGIALACCASFPAQQFP